MAKGDIVNIHVNTGDGATVLTMEATRRGRYLALVKGKAGSWTTVTEMTHTGKAAGNRIQVRTDAVLSIQETKVEA